MLSRIKPFIKGYVRYAYLRQASDYRRALDTQRLQLRYVGWLGHKNAGDEILFEAFRQELFNDCLLMPYHDYSVLSAIALRRRNTAVVLGGGTLINDRGHLAPLEKACRDGRPYFVFGTGVSDPDYWSKFPKARHIDVEGWSRMLAAAQYVGVRGPRSCAWLHAHGVARAEVIGDPALSIALPSKTAAPSGPPVLGINLGAHDPILGEEGADFSAVLALIRTVIARGWRVKYLAMHPIDQRIGMELKRAVQHPDFHLPSFSSDSNTLLRDIASCKSIVGERLHMTVLACALSVPNISLSYQPKCLDFLESIGRADLAVKTDEVTGEVLIERFDWVQERLEEVSDQIRVRCDALRSLQHRRAREIVAALRTQA